MKIYIPFFVGRKEAFDELNSTLRSLKFPSFDDLQIRILTCQSGVEQRIKTLISPDLQASTEVFGLKIRHPILLPIATFRFIQDEGGPDDVCFYLEGDHIVNLAPGFQDSIIDEIRKGNVVMPHRLGKVPVHPKSEYSFWNEFRVGNYAKPGIVSYSRDFERMRGYYNAYAGAFIASRSTIRKHALGYPLSNNILWRGAVEYLRRISGGRLFKNQAPHGLLLEAPSLIFEANGQCVLKPKTIAHFHVIHLSKGGLV